MKSNNTSFEFWAAELDPDTPSLDVHGFSVASALHEVDLFIDRNLMGRYTIIKIIHGAGTGALRKAIYNTFSRDPRVAHIKDSERPGEGGAVAYIALSS